jgi:nucleoside-diphosphate-sugar epimerase
MRIAILGATSQIARDLIISFSETRKHELFLFARRPDAVEGWLATGGLDEWCHAMDGFTGFSRLKFDAVINFVGTGNPAQIMSLGSDIFDITLHFDEMVLSYLRTHPACRYLFLSSGSAYGSKFDEPATGTTPAVVPLNQLAPSDWYGVAKLHAECRHRAHPELSICDIRVFNYFSRSQDIAARFLISDILRAILEKTTLQTSPDLIVRDYLHPSDFHRLVNSLLSAAPSNTPVDCYSLAPVNKHTLLSAMQDRFGLHYDISGVSAGVNATGSKPYYYSQNRRAADFGYQPAWTSLEGILREAAIIIQEHG